MPRWLENNFLILETPEDEAEAAEYLKNTPLQTSQYNQFYVLICSDEFYEHLLICDMYHRLVALDLQQSWTRGYLQFCKSKQRELSESLAYTTSIDYVSFVAENVDSSYFEKRSSWFNNLEHAKLILQIHPDLQTPKLCSLLGLTIECFQFLHDEYNLVPNVSTFLDILCDSNRLFFLRNNSMKYILTFLTNDQLCSINQYGQTYAHLCDVEMLEHLSQTYPEAFRIMIHMQNNDGQTPLFGNNYTKEFIQRSKICIAAGANVNVIDKFGKKFLNVDQELLEMTLAAGLK